MVCLLGDLSRVRVARVIAEAFGYRRQQERKKKECELASFLVHVKQRTANSNILSLRDEVVGNTASGKERPQRPEHLNMKGRQGE